jgi:hypothetical protein
MDDRQISNWSIPSIRLANHVNSKEFYRENSIASLASCEYTDEEMDYTGIEDNDDDDSYASLSSRGSLNDPEERRRRMSRNFLRLTSEGSIGRESEMATTTTTMNNAVFRPLLTNSFEERMRDVSIQGMFNLNSSSSNDHDNDSNNNNSNDNETNVAAGNSTIPTFETEVGVSGPSSPPPLPRRVRTFDHHNDNNNDNNHDDDDEGGEDSPPPILKINVNLTEDMDMARTTRRIDGDQQLRQHRTTRSSRDRRRRRNTANQTTKEGAAVQWIQNLQIRSTDGPQRLIAESASSKFLSGDGATTTLAAALCSVGGVGTAATTSAAAATPSPTRGGIYNNNTTISSSAQQQMSAGAGMTAEEVVKAALGMPHPLCRSSTIEAGPFTLGIHR